MNRLLGPALLSTLSCAQEPGAAPPDVGSEPEPADDAVYPRADGSGGCAAPNTAVPGLSLCAPACDPVGSYCARPDTGSAVPTCAFNPDSSGVTCTTDSACPGRAQGERCLGDAAGGRSCLRPPSHCLLGCDPSRDECPEAMSCYSVGPDQGLCGYP